MPRHVKATTIPKAETLYAVIERHPGADVAELAARVRAETHLDDADANDVRNWLAALDRIGLLVYEEDDGGIRPMEW